MQVQLSAWYSDQGMRLAIYIYENAEQNTHKNVTMGLRFLLTNYTTARNQRIPYIPAKEEILAKITTIFEQYRRERDHPSVLELTNIIADFYPDRATEFLDQVREDDAKYENEALQRATEIDEAKARIENRIAHNEEKKNHVHLPAIKPTVYSDSQNVHNSEINKTVIRALETLYDRYWHDLPQTEEKAFRRLDEIKDSLEGKGDPILISDTISYFRTNTGSFGVRNIKLIDAFFLIWFFIQHADDLIKVDLERRLFEEMYEMNHKCTSGHLSRLINVIQGFTDDPQLSIKISNRDQCKSVIFNYLNSELKKCQDEKVLAGMISTNNEEYKKFLRERVAQKIIDWKTDYGGDFIPQIAKLVNEFAKTDVFKE
jgi:hypothetical protein